MVSSSYVKQGDTVERRARLLAAAKEEVERLQAAKLVGWDVEEDLKIAEARLEAFSQ